MVDSFLQGQCFYYPCSTDMDEGGREETKICAEADCSAKMLQLSVLMKIEGFLSVRCLLVSTNGKTHIDV